MLDEIVPPTSPRAEYVGLTAQGADTEHISFGIPEAIGMADNPDVIELVEALRSESGLHRVEFAPSELARLSAWSVGTRNGGTQQISVSGRRHADASPVSVQLLTDRNGNITRATFQDSRGTSAFDFTWGSAGEVLDARIVRTEAGSELLRFELDREAVALVLGGVTGVGGDVAPSAEEGGGPCWVAVMSFLSALAVHEGGVYLVGLSVSSLIGLGPVAMAAIILTFLGTAGAVGVAAYHVWEDCGLGDVEAQ